MRSLPGIVAVIALSIGLVASLVFGLYNYKKAALLEIEVQIAGKTISSQNKAIKQMEIEFEKYQCNLEAMNEYTRNKYNKVLVEHEDESCEAQMAEFEKALNIYHGADNGKKNNDTKETKTNKPSSESKK